MDVWLSGPNETSGRAEPSGRVSNTQEALSQNQHDKTRSQKTIVYILATKSSTKTHSCIYLRRTDEGNRLGPVLLSDGRPHGFGKGDAKVSVGGNTKQHVTNMLDERRTPAGASALAAKGHVMQHSLPGERIRVFTETKMQIRSKAEKRSVSYYQNVLIVATSHHAAHSITETPKHQKKRPLRGSETMLD